MNVDEDAPERGDDEPKTGDSKSDDLKSGPAADNVDAALAHLKELREHSGDDHVDTLGAINAAAVKLEEAQRYTEAVDLFAEAATKRQKAYGENHILTLRTVNNYALCLSLCQRYDDAEQQLRQCISIANEADVEQEFILTAKSNLGNVLHSLERHDDAVQCFQECVDMRRAACGEQLDEDTLISIGLLANAHEILGHYDVAVTLNVELLEVGTVVLGERHPAILTTLNNLAYEKRMEGKFEESEAYYRRSLAGRRAKSAGVGTGAEGATADADGLSSAEYYLAMENLGVLLAAQDRYDEAEPLLREVISARKELFGEVSAPTLEAMSILAIMLANAHRYEDSLLLAVECLAGQRTTFGDDHPTTLTTIVNLASSYENLSRFGEAIPLYKEAMRGLRVALGEDHKQTLFAMHCLGHCYERSYGGGSEDDAAADAGGVDMRSARQQAQEVYTECLERWRRATGSDSAQTLNTLHHLAVVLCDNGELDASERLYLECVEKKKKVLGEDDPSYLSSLTGLANVYTTKGEHRRALVLLERWVCTVLPSRHLTAVKRSSRHPHHFHFSFQFFSFYFLPSSFVLLPLSFFLCPSSLFLLPLSFFLVQVSRGSYPSPRPGRYAHHQHHVQRSRVRAPHRGAEYNPGGIGSGGSALPTRAAAADRAAGPRPPTHPLNHVPLGLHVGETGSA